MANPFSIDRRPDSAAVYLAGHRYPLMPSGDTWQYRDISVDITRADLLTVDICSEKTQVERVHLRWLQPIPENIRILGDHWERGYGDLQWRGLVPERIMPWYFLATDGNTCYGVGVRTGPAALCFWMVDAEGISLWLDVRCGGEGVDLRGRNIRAAEVLVRHGCEDETPFEAARAFCSMLCPKPRLPDRPVYGSNNWYYAYGNSSHEQILEDTRVLVSRSPGGDNRPYMVIDAGWQPLSNQFIACGAPVDHGNERFPDMPGLAAEIRHLGALPGIWSRPLGAAPDDPESLLLPPTRAIDSSAKTPTLDPSIPDVLERIRSDFQRFAGWGYSLIKHDWTACDIVGRWGFQMGSVITCPGWTFTDRSRTTAEIVLDLYRAIREGSGKAVIIACNSFSHLAAGIFEIQRTGDDTSGWDWERTRRMGPNTLGFRMPQHNTFYAVDADCVGMTDQVPWEKNRQWLDLLSRSGTPLFVSVDPKVIGPEQDQALRDAFAAASVSQPPGEPMDWMHTPCPRRWKLRGSETIYDWTGPDGVDAVPAHEGNTQWLEAGN